MFRIFALVILLLGPIGAEALAQNVNVKLPSAAATGKRERCADEGRKMGLSRTRGRSGGLKSYVAGCMQRK